MHAKLAHVAERHRRAGWVRLLHHSIVRVAVAPPSIQLTEAVSLVFNLLQNKF
jgi:hypothetical protein